MENIMNKYERLPWEGDVIAVPDRRGIVFQPGTVKPEADYLELERLGAKLGIPVPMMFVTLEARDKNGNLTGRYHDRSRTYNRNFWNSVFSFITATATSSGTFGAGVLSIKDTGGTTRTVNGDGGYAVGCGFLHLSAAIGDATIGNVVGTGSTAESFENNALVTKVAHGTGSGQISYGGQGSPVPSYNAGTKVWTTLQSRFFNNNSGGTIVIAETGMYPNITYGSNAQSPTMIERSLLGATVSVLNGGQLTVTYTITLTFPA